MENLKDEIEIALVGKYVELHDAYLSVAESLRHAGYKYHTKININWVNSESLRKENCNLKEIFKNSKGILDPRRFETVVLKVKLKLLSMLEKIIFHF